MTDRSHSEQGPGARPAPGPATGIVVRDATGEDWVGIRPIWRAVVAAGDTYVWDLDEMTEAEERAAWMLPPPAVVLVAVADDGAGAVVGTAEIRPNHPGRGSHVANASFMVDPAFAGRGIGRMLAEAVLDRARCDGYTAMQFNAVVETNTAARALWESIGFTTAGRIPLAFRHRELGEVDLLVMHRSLV
ncbi:GNAT family N-acetyltransferase [Nodularia spumigena]|uniref:GNAT family N-acetyltransferase n=1 Tax=Nodularia spumigena TaxID=70799 RepID=UPI002B221167|nr:GNAT family N-acetyltransferase [Nodularia spumigena]MEA5558054.1 GNAT family N-acetyltransferase [Nodularia spumigena CH309]